MENINKLNYTLFTDLFINGKFVKGVKNQTIPVYNPATEEKICDIAEATEEDVELAIEASRSGFKLWSQVSTDERVRLLNKLADKIEENLQEFSLIESLDNGKPFPDSIEDIKEVVRVIRFYAGLADSVLGTTRTTFDQHTIHVRRVPYGVVACISPWNYPLLMAAWKIFPAIAAGNAVIIKISEETPLTSLRMAKIFQEVGFPDGVLNIIPGYGHVAGNYLTHHHKVNKISFTGSPATGRLILKASAESNLKKVDLELGGKSPMVVFEDANLSDDLINWLVDGAFRNSSQNCSCGSRLFIQESIYDQVVQRVIEQTKSLVIGRYDEENVFIGPLINSRQYERVLNYINHGVEVEKLNLVHGGKRYEKYEKGHFIHPTIFTHVPDSSKLAREEIFGPVLCVMTPFKTIDEAIERANDSDYGLASAIFTQDMNKAEYFVRNIESGTVWINYYNITPYNVAFGGMKQSGFGRDNGEEGLLEYTTTKAVYYRYDFSNMK